MGYRKSVPKLMVGKDEPVLLDDGPATVVDLYGETTEQAFVVVEFLNGDQRLLTLSEYISAAEIVLHNDNPQPAPADDFRWHRLPDELKRQINQRVRDLTLVETGDADGDIYTGRPRSGHIDPRYDPSKYTLAERRARMAHDIESRPVKELRGHSPDTLRRQAQQVRLQGGRNALIHGRTGQRAQRGVTPALERLVEQYVEDELHESRKSVETHVTLLRQRLARFGMEDDNVSDGRLRQLYKDATRGLSYQQPTVTRRSKAGRPDPTRSRGWNITVPFSFIEVDSTPIDQILVDQYGRIQKTTHLLVAVCAATRKVVGLRLTTTAFPYDAREVKGLMWDCVRGRMTGTGALRATCLPDNVVFAPFGTRHDPTRIDSVNIDRGSQYNSKAYLSALNRMGMNARLNDPGRGVQKPHVEAVIRTLTAFGQKLPGYSGSGVHLRGRNIEKRPLLRVDFMLQLLWEVLDTVYHTRPHSRLRHPDFPGHMFSPNEYMALLLRSGGRLTAELDRERALLLLDMRESVLQHKGLEIDRRWYTSDTLKELARKGLGDGSREGLRFTTYVDDRHPEYVLVRLPDGDVEMAMLDGAMPLAPLADLLDRDIRESLRSGSDRSDLRRAARDAESEIIAAAHIRAKTAAETAASAAGEDPSNGVARHGLRLAGKESALNEVDDVPSDEELAAMAEAAMRDIRDAR